MIKLSTTNLLSKKVIHHYFPLKYPMITKLKNFNNFFTNSYTTDDAHLPPEYLNQHSHRPQAATAGRSKNLSVQRIDSEEDGESTVS